VPHPFDVTMKELVIGHAADFAAAFGLPSGVSTELNVDLSTLTAATDVALGFGDPVSEIADLNFQTGPDPHLESRLLLYNAALHHRFQVSVRSILILLRPSADHPSLTGEQVYSGGGGRVEFRYEIVRLWHESPEAFLRGGVGLMPLATLCQPPQGMTVEEMLPGIIDEIGRRLTAEVARPEAV